MHTAETCNKYFTTLFQVLYFYELFGTLRYHPEVLPTSELHPDSSTAHPRRARILITSVSPKRDVLSKNFLPKIFGSSAKFMSRFGLNHLQNLWCLLKCCWAGSLYTHWVLWLYKEMTAWLLFSYQSGLNVIFIVIIQPWSLAMMHGFNIPYHLKSHNSICIFIDTASPSNI